MKRKIQRHFKFQVILLLAIGVMVYVFFMIYFPINLDLTEEKMYSFTPALEEFIEEYPRELTIFSLLAGRSPQEQNFRNFLDELARLNPRITLKHGRPADIADHVEDFRGPMQEDSFLLVEGDRHKVITGMDREHFLRQFYLFCNQEELKVGYLTGYEEMPLSEEEHPQFTLQAFRTVLENNGFVVEEITFEDLLDDSYFLAMLVSPMQDIDSADLEYLEMYWRHGGNLILSMDPELKAPRDTMLPWFVEQKWGLQMVEGIVIQHAPMDAFLDRDPLKSEITDIIHPFFQLHFREHGEILLRQTSAFMETREHTAERIPLFQTGENTWLQRDMDKLREGEVGFDPDNDIEGPLYPAYAIEEEMNRALVFADSDWMTNRMIFEKNNHDLVQSMIRYFAPQIKAIDHMPGTYRIKTMSWDAVTRRRILYIPVLVTGLILAGLVLNVVRDKRQ